MMILFIGTRVIGLAGLAICADRFVTDGAKVFVSMIGGVVLLLINSRLVVWGGVDSAKHSD